MVISGLFLIACSRTGAEEEDHVLMTIDGQEVDEKEGRLYLEMMRQVYEEKAGEEIWEVPLSGRDSTKTAAENALNSLIRTKLTAKEYDASRLTDAEKRSIERGMVKLFEAIGEDRMQVLGLTMDDLYTYMEESYRSYHFERSMSFLPGSMEEELESDVAEKFIAYETLDQDSYLEKAEVDAIMIYTGQWVGDRWVSYPEAQRQEKLAQMEQIYDQMVDGGNFTLAVWQYSEDKAMSDCPLFTEGVVQSETEGILYRGQIQSTVADAIFKTPTGEMTGILDTSYGYLLVKVKGFSLPKYIDRLHFRKQLEAAQASYREDLIQTLQQEQQESEYQRLLEDAKVVVHDAVWERIVGE